MKDFIIIVILLIIVALVVTYIYRSIKKGKKCIGCPYGENCGGCCGKK